MHSSVELRIPFLVLIPHMFQVNDSSSSKNRTIKPVLELVISKTPEKWQLPHLYFDMFPLSRQNIACWITRCFIPLFMYQCQFYGLCTLEVVVFILMHLLPISKCMEMGKQLAIMCFSICVLDLHFPTECIRTYGEEPLGSSKFLSPRN